MSRRYDDAPSQERMTARHKVRKMRTANTPRVKTARRVQSLNGDKS